MTDEPLVNPHRSATLKYVEQAGLDSPPDNVACVDCPAGIWHRSQDQRLVCFCTVLHRDTWTAKLDPILICDGRDAAIARLVPNENENQSR